MPVSSLQNEVMCGFACHTAFIAKDNALVFRREEVSASNQLAHGGDAVCVSLPSQACLLPPPPPPHTQIDKAHKRTRSFSKDFGVKLKFAELPPAAS